MSTRPLTARRWNCLRPAGIRSRACPAAVWGSTAPRDLLATMGGDRDDVPPVHGVLTP